MMHQSVTVESKAKGGDGIYAALDAARLACALRGATASRLITREKSLIHTTTPAGPGPFSLASSSKSGGKTTNSGIPAAATSSTVLSSAPILGVVPKSLAVPSSTERVWSRIRKEALFPVTRDVKDAPENVCERGVEIDMSLEARERRAAEKVQRKLQQIDYHAQPAVGLPEEIHSEDLRALLPFLHRLRPAGNMTYDDTQRLLRLLHGAGGASYIATLDLGAGAALPSAVTGKRPGDASADGEEEDGTTVADDDGSVEEAEAPSEAEPAAPFITLEALEALVEELKLRYPLPLPKQPKKRDADADGEEEEEEEEEEEDDEAKEALRHNEDLRARCELLQIPYTDYAAALREVALYEAEVFPLICDALSANTELHTVVLSHNALGAESRGAGGGGDDGAGSGSVDLRCLRALARMIDANEHMQVLDLSHNDLRANGVGIVAKALTKNISLREVDLSENGLNLEPLEENEDPEFVEEDPVFGERYAGLEALSEVLKKNKFLRVLRLAGNGIHAGDDLTAPPDEEIDDDDDGEGLAGPTSPDVIEGWAEVPLWQLVGPLRNFHRITVLDLRGNQLGPRGARMLATALATNRSVRAVDLTDNGIGSKGLHYLAVHALSSPTSVLETLVLQRNDLAGKSLNPNTQKKLRLKPKKAVVAAMLAFAAALHGNRTLRRLVLSENHLGPILSAALLSTVHRADALEELDFSWNEACGDHESSLDLTAMQNLATALYPAIVDGEQPPRRPTLQRLYLSGNNLCAAGLAALFPDCGLAPHHALTDLDLSRNYVGDALEPLSGLLRSSPVLRRLCLAHNCITTVSSLLVGLRANNGLTTLDLSNNRLGSQEEERHLPANLFAPPPPLRTSVTGGSSSSSSVGSGDAGAAAAGRAEGGSVTTTGSSSSEVRAQRGELAVAWDVVAAHPTLADLNVASNDLRAGHARDLLTAFTQTEHAAPAMERVDVSGNPKIPARLVAEILLTFGARAGMKVVHVSIPKPFGQPNPSPHGAASTIIRVGEDNSRRPDLNSVVVDEKQRAADAALILQAMQTVVSRSSSLLDVCCSGGLLRALSGGSSGGALVLSDEVEAAVEAMRRRLLLNALLTKTEA